MGTNSSIQDKITVKDLEKLIGVEHKTDFAEFSQGFDQFGQIHRNALLITYSDEALNQIKCQLGYLPRREVTIESEPAIRQLLFEYHHHHSDIDVLFNSCNPILDEIYMREMKPHSIADYSHEIYNLYETLLPEYKGDARARIIRHIKYIPEFKDSVYAELVMRCRMAQHTIIFNKEPNEADWESEGITWFREHYTSCILNNN